MKKITLIIVSIFSLSPLYAQPTIQWQRSLGGTLTDQAYGGVQTADGGYVVTGYSNSIDGDVIGNHGGYDYWVVKLDSNGIIQWQKSLGGSGGDISKAILQTTDGGCVVSGNTISNDGDVTGNHGSTDYWLIKLDTSGNIQWQKTYGGSGGDGAADIQHTSDGGYIIGGSSASTDGDVTGNHGSNDFWVVKTDSAGTIQWEKSYGGTSSESAYSIRQTTDGGYIVAGETQSNDGDVTGYHGNKDCWVVKLDANGILQWQRSLGGFGIDIAYSVTQTSGGCIVTGATGSNDGDVLNNTMPGPNYWIVKLDNSGVIQWQKLLGSNGCDIPYSVETEADGGCVVAGYSPICLTSSNDVWIVKLDSNGVTQWQQCYGGTNNDEGNSIRLTNDNGYIVTCRSNSNDGDVTGNHGNHDYWVVKLSPVNCLASFSLYPDSLIPHTYWAINQSYGIPPIQYDWDWGDGSPHDTVAYPSHIYAAAGMYSICLGISDSVGCTSNQCFNHSLARLETTNTMVYVNVVNSIPTSIRENQVKDISLYPNPATTEIVVESAEFNVERIEMYSVVGERVKVLPLNPLKGTYASIDVSSLPSGIYFVAVTDEKGNKAVRKIVKM